MKSAISFYTFFGLIFFCEISLARGPRRVPGPPAPAPGAFARGSLELHPHHIHASHLELPHHAKHFMTRRWGWPHKPWGWGWKPGVIAGKRYAFVLPLEAQKLLYPKGYAQWGDQLDETNALTKAATAGDWHAVREQLCELRKDAQQQLEKIDKKDATAETGQERAKLKHRLNLIQLHLDGITTNRSELFKDYLFQGEAL